MKVSIYFTEDDSTLIISTHELDLETNSTELPLMFLFSTFRPKNPKGPCYMPTSSGKSDEQQFVMFVICFLEL